MQLAKAGTTLIVPADLGNVGAVVGTALRMVQPMAPTPATPGSAASVPAVGPS